MHHEKSTMAQKSSHDDDVPNQEALPATCAWNLMSLLHKLFFGETLISVVSSFQQSQMVVKNAGFVNRRVGRQNRIDQSRQKRVRFTDYSNCT